MPTKKLTQQDLEWIEGESNHGLFEHCFTEFPDFRFDGSLVKSVEKYVAAGLSESVRKERSNAIKLRAAEYLKSKRSGWDLETVIEGIEPYFEGSRPNASNRAKTLFRNFQYQNELMLNAWEFFRTHLENSQNFFSADIFKQWLAAVRVGLYTAPDYYVLGRSGLNYPDNADPSPRLEAVKNYYRLVCMSRIWVEIFEQEIHRWCRGGDSYNFVDSDWTDYLKKCREQLNRNFGSERGQKLFNDIFGGPDPSKPANSGDMDTTQMKFFTKLAEELLRGGHPQPSQGNQNSQDNRGEGSFNRDYAGEQREAEARAREEQERQQRERENSEPEPQEPQNNNYRDDNGEPKPEENREQQRDRSRSRSPSREAGEQQAEGQKPETPPKHTEFNSSELNDALNAMADEMGKDSKAQGHDQPFTPSPGLGMPITAVSKEDAEKMPWICMGMNVMASPEWRVSDNAWFAGVRHGSGDIITMLLWMHGISLREDYSDVFHNFFFPTNLGTDQTPIKGFQRLVVDKDLPAEKEQLLITGKRADDPRADKYNWTSWPWKGNESGKSIYIPVRFGVPRVEQKSYRFTRKFRNQKNAYDLESTSHFIGILRDKKLMTTKAGFWHTIGWGSGPKKSILWITNQLGYDWGGDKTKAINTDNGYSHYLIFSNFTTQEINEKFIPFSKTLPELVGKLKGTLVRIGPDALELIDSQTPQQKERSQNETPESREDNRKEPTDQDLTEMGLTREEFDLLNTAFADPAHIANIIKKLAASDNPQKVAEMLNRMFDHLNPKTAEAMFNQMVDNNPVFSEEEKQKLKDLYNQAKTKEEKKKVWETLTSHQAQREAHAKKDKKEKDKIFEEQVNNNPRYGPPGEDTQDRRNRFEEYQKADDTQKEKMQTEENEHFTTGENANQWGSYFQDNANREAGAGDESVGTETDNNFNGQFSFTDSLNAINKLKNIGSMKPEGMEEGMKSNKPYWQVVFSHPLTYIFLFIGIIIAIMAAATKKDR
jgi:hypothetical protein